MAEQYKHPPVLPVPEKPHLPHVTPGLELPAPQFKPKPYVTPGLEPKDKRKPPKYIIPGLERQPGAGKGSK